MNSAKPHRSKVTDDLLSIWTAGVHAVKPENVVRQKIAVDGRYLLIDTEQIDLRDVSRLIVVGAGKASAAMARSLMGVLRESVKVVPPVVGWVNCPEGCAAATGASAETGSGACEHAGESTTVLTLGRSDHDDGVHLFEARPMGINAPTEKAVLGTQEILRHVRSATSKDVVICLISGGGSALLVAPRDGVTLEDKQAVATLVAGAGADIEQLNCLRRCLSDVKGGGLARNCNAGRMLAVLISDVLGDPLETIASGPCVVDRPPDYGQALSTLESFGILEDPRLAAVVAHLRRCRNKQEDMSPTEALVEHVVLANNADAVDAAGVRAVELGYQYIMQAATGAEGDVEEVAKSALRVSKQLLDKPGFDCWISGGEPSVTLPPSPGKGGRNQHLALRVLDGLANDGWPENYRERFAFVSGGTDGEDGPTDAAGAWFDDAVLSTALQLGLSRSAHLDAANAYPFFSQTGGLLNTGPTGTNVCDLRVALVRRD